MGNTEQLKSICDDIYTITGIKASIYDANMRCLYGHPYTMSRFCRCVRKNPTLTAACYDCDRAGFARCRQTGEVVIYRCHMGLTEAVAPIMDNNAVIGYLLFGQILSGDALPQVKEAIQKGSIAEKAELLEALEEMEPAEERIIGASARLMSMCTSYIKLRDLLRIRKEGIAVQIDGFIGRNLKNTELSIPMLCREFGISRGSLYTLSKNEFGMGITEYIRKVRIREALNLLRRTDLPVFRIAEEVGIPDPNYLARLIKQTTGMTPKKLQKFHEKCRNA